MPEKNFWAKCRNPPVPIDKPENTALMEQANVKYLCLVYAEERLLEGWPDAECAACAQDFEAAGHLLGAEPLHPVRTAATVQVRNGTISVTDGPFAETREQLAGFYLLDARDLNEAIQLAARIPPARVGSIEVRPVRELKP